MNTDWPILLLFLFSTCFFVTTLNNKTQCRSFKDGFGMLSGLGKVSLFFTPPPPHPHSTACVWPASWGAWLGKGVPNLHPRLAPPVCGRNHGAPDLEKVSPNFTPLPPPPHSTAFVAGIMGRLTWERCPQSSPPPPPPLSTAYV